MKVLKQIALALLLVPASCNVAGAQSLKYPPSSHDPGCGGIFCNPIDPQVPQAPAPPCQGLLCSLNPNAFQPPLTAAQAQEAQRAQAEAAAAAPSATPPIKKVRKVAARKKIQAAKAASRTPDPAVVSQ